MPENSLLISPKVTVSHLPQPCHPAFLWWRWQRSNFYECSLGRCTFLCERWYHCVHLTCEVEKQSFSIYRALRSTLKGRVRDCFICLQSILYSLWFSCVFFLSPFQTGLVKMFLSVSCERWGCTMEGTSELEPGSPAQPRCSCVTLDKWLYFPHPVTAPASRDEGDTWGDWVREWMRGDWHSMCSQ